MRAIMVFLLLCLNGCSLNLTGDCAETTKAQTVSPDGKYVATVYERDCGATTDFSTIVNVRLSNAKFSEKEGDIFIVRGQPTVNLTWESSTGLKISCTSCDKSNLFWPLSHHFLLSMRVVASRTPYTDSNSSSSM